MRKIQSHKSASNVHNSWRKRENRKSCLHKLSDIGLRLIWGSPSVRICAQIWRSLLNLQQGTNVFHCADFWTKDFLMFKFCIFGFLEFEDFGREKWGWRRGRLWAKKGGGCRLLGGKSWTAQFFTLLAGFNVHYPARHLGNDKYHPILSW